MFISILWHSFSNEGELGSFLVVKCDLRITLLRHETRFLSISKRQ
jgi:hypothetical protein